MFEYGGFESRGRRAIGASRTREAFGVRGIPALWDVENGGKRRSPKASRIKLALVRRRAGTGWFIPLVRPLAARDVAHKAPRTSRRKARILFGSSALINAGPPAAVSENYRISRISFSLAFAS